MTQHNLYFAGLFDGEGTILINKWINKKQPTYHPRFTLISAVNMCDSRPLKFGKSIWGGTINPIRREAFNPKWHDTYQWTLSGKKAMKFLLDIQEFSLVKRPQIDCILPFYEIKKQKSRRLIPERTKKKGFKHGGYVVMSDKAIKELEAMKLKLQELKKIKLH